MLVDYNIFSVKPTEFETGQRDPFGFDYFTEKLASKYLPFSGTVRKPIYFFFTHFADWFCLNQNIKSSQKKEVQLRLEKLLVFSWKEKSDTLKGKNVLGNSRIKINPFKGDDGRWIIQNCFKIYGASSDKVINTDEFIKKYRIDNPDEQNILKEFLSKDGLLDNRNEKYLEDILKKLSRKKHSLFCGNHLLSDKYKNIFLKYLHQSIYNTNPDYYNDIYLLFENSTNLAKRIQSRTLFSEKKYPFKSLNDWFAAFIVAVDKDLNKEDSKSAWKKADELYQKIPNKYKNELSLRPEPKCWFEKSGDHYIPIEDKTFDEEGWNALLNRTRYDYMYDFKHTALISLLNESLQ
ncbi:MAG: hypothetical protein M0P71_06365 [Melioribacteraceae bacterium]|nr:hypothetical protein [Melioribacteraceae bacterium]